MAMPNDPAPGPSIVNPASGNPPTNPSGGEPKLPESLHGKMTQEEFAALPDAARTVLVERAKTLQADYTKKTQELADQRKSLEGLLAIQTQLDADPKLAKHLDQALADYKAGRISKQELQDEWEQLKVDADEGGLRVLKAIEKRFGASEVSQELKALKEMVGQLVSGTQQSRRMQLETEIGKIPEAFKPLAEEHREKILRLGLTPTFAQESVRDLLMRVAPREAYESAYLKHHTATSEAEVAKVQELAGFPSAAGTPETPVLAPEDRVKSRDPRFGDGIRFSSVITRLVNEAKRRLPGI